MPYPAHLKQFDIDRNTDAFYKSQGFKKLRNFFEDFVKRKIFQDFIMELREDFNIPKGGFSLSANTWTTPPPEWSFSRESKQYKNFKRRINNFCETIQLPSKDWDFTIEEYVFFNKIFISHEPNSHNLCYVTDLLTKQDSVGQELNENLVHTYPVALLISPYASKRDIDDYISRIYKTEILPIQKKYQEAKSFIGKSRAKNGIIQRRNNSIYKNRHLPVKQIAKIIAKEFNEIMDEGAICKILSLEEIKRS